MKPLWNTPVADEIEAHDLVVTGHLPRGLAGTYIRNGGNARPGRDGHDFAAQGMLHGVRIGDRRAQWYRNRWIDSARSTANTSILAYAGKVLALVENTPPVEITSELATLDTFDFGGRLLTGMTAHPKRDPATGLLHFFGYAFRPPFLTYHVASADGVLLQSMPIDVPAPTMMHDFAITEHHVVWLDQPVVFDLALARRGAMPFRWSDEHPTRVGVMVHGATSVRWFDVSPGYAFHVANAHETAGAIVLEAVRYDRAAFEATWEVLGAPPVGAAPTDSGANLHRWELDLVRGSVREESIDAAPIEFPTIDTARTGRANRFTYAVTMPRFATGGAELVKYDRGKRRAHRFDAGWVPGEAIFVPSPDHTEEDDGWLMLFIGHAFEDRSRFAIHDALTLDPVAEIRLPRRVPAGFHGAWLPD